ncbi:hypothetical protein ACLQ2L_21465 [Streptomyces sp. DT203]
MSQLQGHFLGAASDPCWKMGDVLPRVYRVTKYDSADHDKHGHYTGTEDTVSDHGEIEAPNPQAVEAFAAGPASTAGPSASRRFRSSCSSASSGP